MVECYGFCKYRAHETLLRHQLLPSTAITQGELSERPRAPLRTVEMPRRVACARFVEPHPEGC